MAKKMDAMNLPEKERKAYDKYLRHLMSIASRNHTIEIDAKEIIKKAKEEEQIKTIMKLHSKGKSAEEISDLLDLTLQEVKAVIESLKKSIKKDQIRLPQSFA